MQLLPASGVIPFLSNFSFPFLNLVSRLLKDLLKLIFGQAFYLFENQVFGGIVVVQDFTWRLEYLLAVVLIAPNLFKQ